MQGWAIYDDLRLQLAAAVIMYLYTFNRSVSSSAAATYSVRFAF